MTARRADAKRGMTWPAVRALAKTFAGVEDGTSYGTPAMKVRKKLLARLKEDGETIVVSVDRDARDALLELDPEAFFLTDHYRAYPAMLVRLAQVRPELLAGIFEQACAAP